MSNVTITQNGNHFWSGTFTNIANGIKNPNLFTLVLKAKDAGVDTTEVLPDGCTYTVTFS